MSALSKSYLALKPSVLLAIILVVATVLRFWNWFNIPFTHDEMSALLRTRFDNFSDLFEYGVKVDTHPPGIQVFMYYWIKLGGESMAWVKLPFILCGLGLIYFTYRFGKLVFNESVGLISASFLSVLQFSVMYSQISRPYITGSLFAMGMLYYCAKMIKEPQQSFLKNYIYIVLFAVLSAYNHHFSLLLAGLIGLFTLTYLPKNLWLKFSSIALIALLLYLPNIGIFMSQLKRGGVGDWLGAPTSGFVIDFIKYAFHYSYLILLLVIGIVVLGIITARKDNTPIPKKWILLTLGISLTYFVIGFGYSVLKAPILQFSMMLFIFPMLLLGGLGWMPKLKNNVNTVLITLILCIGTMSLSLERKHYETFYHTRYFQMVLDANQTEWGADVIYTNIPNFVTFAERQYSFKRRVPYFMFNKDYSTIKDFQQILDSCSSDQLVLGMLETCPKELITLARVQYPFMQEKRDYHGATTYRFSKNESQNIELSYWNYSIDFSNQLSANKRLINQHDSLTQVSSEGSQYHFSNVEYGIGMNLGLTPKIEHKYDMIHIEAIVQLDDVDSECNLVASFNESEKEPLWRSMNSQQVMVSSKGIATLHITLDRNIIESESVKLKTYLWTPSKLGVTVLSYKCELLEGNRNKYCLFDPIYRK